MELGLPCQLTNQSQMDLLWWLHNIPGAVCTLRKTNPTRLMRTDSSDYAWGGHLDTLTAQGNFSPAEKALSINIKETLAIWYCLQSFRSHLRDCHLKIESDSTCAIAYIRDMGGMKSELHSKIAADVWDLADELKLQLSISHVPGKWNTVDVTSRILSYRTKWCLPKKWVSYLCSHFNITPTIDMFASRLNNKCDRYAAFAPNPYCEVVDCFTTSWTDEVVYSFQPFNLTHRVLSKINNDKCTALIIFPFWPNQPWFSLLTNMLLTTPVMLPEQCQVYLPWDLDHKHPNPHLKLCSAVVCGKDYNYKVSHLKHLLELSNPQPYQQEKVTQLTSPNGYCFVRKGKAITCNRLLN